MSSDKAKLIVSLLVILACVFGIVQISKANESSRVLMLGTTLNDLTESDRARFANYVVFERAYFPPDKMGDLIKQIKPSLVIIRQPSGGLYEYTPEGSLTRELSIQDPRQNLINKQQMQNFNNPVSMGQVQQMPLMPPMQMPVCCTPMYMPMQPMQTNRPPMQMNYGGGMAPNMQMMLPNGGPQTRLMPSQMNMANVQRPFPGANVPTYLFPGKSEFSYLPGEGDVLPPPGISAARGFLKQAATIAQNNTFPLWFDSYLTTDTSTTTASNAGFPTLRFSADTTSNAAVVGSQWMNTGIGLGAGLVDAYLDSVEIKARREAAHREALGTPYYYYPDYARTRYPSMPYQPLPTSPWY